MDKQRIVEALQAARIYVKDQNDAEGMLDGFGGRKPRPSDSDLRKVDEALSSLTAEAKEALSDEEITELAKQFDGDGMPNHCSAVLSGTEIIDFARALLQAGQVADHFRDATKMVKTDEGAEPVEHWITTDVAGPVKRLPMNRMTGDARDTGYTEGWNAALDAVENYATLSQSAEKLTCAKADPRNRAGAIMPDGSMVTNVYEAFEAGKRSAEKPAVPDGWKELAEERFREIKRAQAIIDELRAERESWLTGSNGWKLAPKEPTPEMRKAAADAWLDCGSKMILNKASAAVKAAIAAAPAQEGGK